MDKKQPEFEGDLRSLPGESSDKQGRKGVILDPKGYNAFNQKGRTGKGGKWVWCPLSKPAALDRGQVKKPQVPTGEGGKGAPGGAGLCLSKGGVDFRKNPYLDALSMLRTVPKCGGQRAAGGGARMRG